MNTLREHLRYMGRELKVPDHPAYLRELLGRGFAHSVRVLPDAVREIELDNLTCFGFALGAHDSANWSDLAIETYVMNSRFVEILIEEGSLERVEQARNGDLVIYHAKRVTHAGVVSGERIISKWGIGWVYDHALWEVPLQYGSNHVYYRRPQLSVIEDAFYRLRKKYEVLHFSLLHPNVEDEE